jgi:DNA replication factor GINS
MNLEDLRSAQTRERATDGLQDLRDSFYGDVAEYIADLKDRREAAAEAADDPFGDPEVQELTDKIETAEQVAEAIYERRMGKLVKQASLAAAGMPDDEDGLTAEEQTLYADLVDRIEANKAHVLDVISGDAEPADGDTESASTESERADGLDSVPDSPVDRAESAREPSTEESAASESSAAAAMGGGMEDAGTDPVDAEPSSESTGTAADPAPPADAEPPEAVAEDLARVQGDGDDTGEEEPVVVGEDDSGDGGERVKVRVTDDVGEIFGVDERPYELKSEDVVTLPEENAAPLVEKDAAERLD